MINQGIEVEREEEETAKKLIRSGRVGDRSDK